MTRIIAGTAGGRRIRTPRGAATRPTSDRVRESLFASLTSLLGDFEGVRVLDLFAGSGALGLEALSRGAAEAVFVERDRSAAACITANLRDLGLQGRVQRTDVGTFLDQAPATPAHLVLYDPPYDRPADDVTGDLARLVRRGHATPDAVVVVERSSRSPDVRWPEGLEPLRDKAYGETRLWYGRPHD